MFAVTSTLQVPRGVPRGGGFRGLCIQAAGSAYGQPASPRFYDARRNRSRTSGPYLRAHARIAAANARTAAVQRDYSRPSPACTCPGVLIYSTALDPAFQCGSHPHPISIRRKYAGNSTRRSAVQLNIPDQGSCFLNCA